MFARVRHAVVLVHLTIVTCSRQENATPNKFGNPQNQATSNQLPTSNTQFFYGYRPLFRQLLLRQNVSENAQVTLTLTLTLTVTLTLTDPNPSRSPNPLHYPFRNVGIAVVGIAAAPTPISYRPDALPVAQPTVSTHSLSVLMAIFQVNLG